MTTTALSDPKIVPNPFPVYAELAENQPVHWCEGLGAWAVLKYDDCVNGLRNDKLSAHRMDTVLDLKFPDHGLPPDSIYYRFTNNVMMYTDEPLHGALRKSTLSAFTREAFQHYDAVIKQVAYDLVATIPDSRKEIDAVAELASILPVNAAVRAFGLPEEDLEFVLPRVEVIMTFWSGSADQPIGIQELMVALEDLHTYSVELVEGKRGKVTPDSVIERLAASLDPDGDVTLQQTIHQLVLLLIALFAPTTPGSASSGTLSFARNPDQVERFRADPNCRSNAANEVFRYNASNQFTWRRATEAMKIGDVDIAEGQAVALFIGAANRDSSVFDDPDKFDLDRANSGRHLSFGSGLHACLGREIASLEIAWFFTALFERYSKIDLAGDPVWNPNLEFRSLKELPLGLT